ncbi:hypothetical protein [Leucothrix arctica]|uniref:Uncharacterized protein n=1 Tax=Leucothrix arctica TaxID=1481894 RepID=A0A317CBQ4_9GAMM|nr:hypothetical protein [Leucothrix arctica]PWQ94753.1 hypothetical protein DKT75_15825 [Leucothrix arctica]
MAYLYATNIPTAYASALRARSASFVIPNKNNVTANQLCIKLKQMKEWVLDTKTAQLRRLKSFHVIPKKLSIEITP